ncbi:MAG TPA: gliding motility lipoprotein GldB [Ohtaekwangia sp.]
MRRLLVIGLVALVQWGCTETKTDECVTAPEQASEKIPIPFEQFQDSLLTIQSKSQLVALFTRQPLIRDYIFRRTEYPDDSVFINEIFERLTNPHLDTLGTEVQRVFGDLSSLKTEFTEAFTNLKAYYPDFRIPKIQTVISGLDTDMLLTDSLIIVSLDFYLGRGAKYRPQMYEYLLRKYDPDDIVPSALLIYGIDERFNHTDLKDKTVLADMIAYGKSFYFAKHMLPCVADSVFIWYTPEEMKGVRENKNLIWARFIESEVLFATSQMVKKDYLSERPVTIQVGEKCPGRIGQWVGWEIVKSYMDSHPDLSLPQLMTLGDAQTFFKESRFNPKK